MDWLPPTPAPSSPICSSLEPVYCMVLQLLHVDWLPPTPAPSSPICSSLEPVYCMVLQLLQWIGCLRLRLLHLPSVAVWSLFIVWCYNCYTWIGCLPLQLLHLPSVCSAASSLRSNAELNSSPAITPTQLTAGSVYL